MLRIFPKGVRKVSSLTFSGTPINSKGYVGKPLGSGEKLRRLVGRFDEHEKKAEQISNKQSVYNVFILA